MNKKTVKDIDLTGKKVLLRVDYNVSQGTNLAIGDHLRIEQTLTTIKYLLDKKCTLFLVSHLGRPGGKNVKNLSLKPVADYLEKILDKKVNFIAESIGSDRFKDKLTRISIGTVNLLENIRFYPEEEENDLKLAKELTAIADVYVNDAFGVAHRRHVSTVGVTHYLPAVAGLLMEKEVEMIAKAANKPQQPLVIIIGGAKVKTKMALLEKLLGKAESILFGGVIANTFLKAQGYEMGRSLVDEEMEQRAKQILRMVKQNRTKIVLPEDMVVGDLDKNQYQGVVKISEISEKLQTLDIGPKTQAVFGKIILNAETIIWNGPMGVHENPKFAVGTAYVYQMIAENRGSLSIVGGGDTLTALKNEDYLETIDHVSTGGGAMLELIEKGTLPGIEALLDK